MTTDLPNGIYFGMPEDQYHALPRLSASGIKTLRVSPLRYWRESLDPNRKPSQDSEPKKLGRAYHKLLLEGEEAFGAAYAVTPCKEDYPDALSDAEALRARCEELGLKKSGTLAEMCARIREVDPSAQLWPDILAEFDEVAGARERIKRDEWLEIQSMAYVIRRMPSLRTAFAGGFPEVTILWTHTSGVPMKARLDYLKPRGEAASIIDIKSFGNVMDKPIEDVPANEISRNRYFIQPVVYTDARNAAGAMWRQKRGEVVHVVSGDAPGEDWLSAVFGPSNAQFHFVFVQTGGVPDIIAREFRPYEDFSGLGVQGNQYWGRGLAEYRYGVALYRQCMEKYGPDVPWVTDHGLRPLKDEDFPLWALSNDVPLIDDEAA